MTIVWNLIKAFLVGGALCIQGMMEGVVGWFGESTFLQQLQLQLDTRFVRDIMLAKLLEINESTWQQLQGVVDVVKSVPVGLRFLLGRLLRVLLFEGKLRNPPCQSLENALQ